MDLVTWAETEGRRRLSGIGTRWRHSEAVAVRAGQLAIAVEPEDRAMLVAAALLHDVGYAPELVASGFHPLDGARWLAAKGHHRLAGIVAHHTGARFEAEVLGLDEAIDAFVDEASAVSDALTYSDLTTGPAGERMTVAQRLEEIERRYGASSVVVQALDRASSSLLAMVARTELRLPDTAAGRLVA